MGTIRRFGSALVLAALMAIGVGSATLQAAKPGPPPKDTVCAYLWSVITYPNVNPTIQQVAWQLFNAYGCTVPN